MGVHQITIAVNWLSEAIENIATSLLTKNILSPLFFSSVPACFPTVKNLFTQPLEHAMPLNTCVFIYFLSESHEGERYGYLHQGISKLEKL